MVLNVEVQNGLADTFLFSPTVDPPMNPLNEGHYPSPADDGLQDTSFRSYRDTSHTDRDMQDTSRSSAVNMHSSILDITEDCEDEDDEENADFHGSSFLFPNEHADTSDPLNESLDYPPSPTLYKQVMSPEPRHGKHSSCCVPLTPTEMTTPLDTSLLDRMTERFVETLCFQGEKVKDESLAWETTKRSVEYDILELLGCASPPDEDEMEQVWAWNQSILNCVKPDALENKVSSPPRPRRHSMRDRAARLHRLRTERAMQQANKKDSFFQSPSPSPTSVLSSQSRVRSMDDRLYQLQDPLRVIQLEDDLVKHIGFGMEPIPHDEIELGYDSDPEEFSFHENRRHKATTRDPPVKLFISEPVATLPVAPVGENIEKTIQDVLNQTWNLTWHAANKPAVSIDAWIERGTLVHSNNRMLEPNLMWRESYQADLGQRKLNPSSQKPFNVRLLNICRILEAPTVLDRSAYPTARASCSFWIRTSDDSEYLFEAPTFQARDAIVRRWKICVARFATLAVMEDMSAITAEFFSPMVTSQMLVPNYQH